MELFSGLDYLKIDIANNFGLDKKTYQERISWFNSTIEPEINKDSDNTYLLNLAQSADEIPLAYQGLRAYRDYLNKIPNGYMISFDATTSGIQIMSALTTDIKGMTITNSLEPEKRYDCYSEVFNFMKDKYLSGSDDEQISSLKREDIKKAIMILMYGGKKSVIKHLKGNEQAFDLLLKACDELLPKAFTLYKTLMDLVDKKLTRYSWITPDNFHINQVLRCLYKETHTLSNGKTIDIKYKAEGLNPSYKGVANFIHSVDAFIMREVIGRCSYNPKKVKDLKDLIFVANSLNSGSEEGIEGNEILSDLYKIYKETNFLSIRFIEYINNLDEILYLNQDEEFMKDLLKLLDTLSKYKPFEMTCIHDCYKCHPNNMGYVRYWYNFMLSELVRCNILKFMISQLPNGENLFNERIKPLINFNQSLIRRIKNNNYSLC